jgi:ribosomal protein S18 acetylase RimI-like enzyme
MAEVVVRGSQPEDFDAAFAVWRDASTARRGGLPPSARREEQVRETMRTPDALHVVADDGGTIVGMALAQVGRADEGMGEPVPGLCFVAMAYVTPDRWGQGIGGRLLEAVLAEASARGYDRAHLWTHATNRRAQRLYERHGFRRTGREMIDAQGERNVQYERRG